MKLTHKNSSLHKKNMNLTAQLSDVLKTINKKPTPKNATAKLTRTSNGKTLNPHPNIMTEQDIDRLFKNHSKEKLTKQTACVNTKVSTQNIDGWGASDNKDFVNSIKFLKVDDQWDKLLTGIPSDLIDQAKIDALFQSPEKKDLTMKFKADYQVGKIIGEGAYASVRVAIYRPLHRTVAIKVYEKNKIKEPQRKKSVRREIRILQMLNHPNIVKIYDVVETNNHLNIIMEYLDGTSLGSFLKAQHGTRIPEKICKKVFRELAKALRYMHSLKIAHRDIKLENIILDDNFSPKFIDFGFSTCIQSKKKIKIFCGTPSYMAPEVVQRKQYRGETADIWALGVLLFVSITGIFPFKGATDQELYNKINNAEYPKGQLYMSKSLADLISKMLTIEPEQRISASQILQHQWFSTESKNDSKKKTTQNSLGPRKRINTVESNKEKDWANKTNKKVFAQTCKDNLKLQIRKALKSPSNKQINSYRKMDNNKENTIKGLRSEKTTFREHNSNNMGGLNNLLNKQLKTKNKVRQKVNNFKNQTKVIDLLRFELKKKQSEKSKSKSRNKRL